MIIFIITLVAIIWGVGVGALYEWDPFETKIDPDSGADIGYMFWPIVTAILIVTSPLWVSILVAGWIVRKLREKRLEA